MPPPSGEAQQDPREKTNPSASVTGSASDPAESNNGLLESAAALWSVLTSQASATVGAFKLDIKLAASSLIALLVAGFVIAALLLGLWFLGMGLIVAGLIALQVPVVVALLVIVSIQLALLLCCWRFAKRMLTNLHFKAVRATLSDTADSEIRS